jgi:RHH-type rel operon transcriptional repressor/antitoxin RelB
LKALESSRSRSGHRPSGEPDDIRSAIFDKEAAQGIAIRRAVVVEAPLARFRREVSEQEHTVKRTAENKLKVVAVRVDPAIERRLRLLAEVTGRRQSYFLQQMIESGIGAMEEAWLPPAVLAQVRDGTLPTREQMDDAMPDLFSGILAENET